MANNTVRVTIDGVDNLSNKFKDIAKEAERAFESAQRQLEQLQANLRSLNAPNLTIDVNADTATANAQIDAAARNRTATINTEANTAGALVKINGIASAVAGMPMLSPLLAIAPAIIPAIAGATFAVGNLAATLAAAGTAAVAGVGAIASSFAAAGLGVAAFAAVAIPSIAKFIEESNKMKQFKSWYDGFAADFQKPVFTVLENGLSIVQKSMESLRPAINGVADVFVNMSNKINSAISGSGTEPFFKFINENAPRAVENFTTIGGNLMKGFFGILQAFAPLGAEMESWLVKLTGRFAEWGMALEGSKGFDNFINFVKETGIPALKNLGEIFGNVFNGVVGIIKAFFPTQEQFANNMVKMTEKFEAWGQSLGSNKAFHNFVDYAQTNGPVLIATIGNVVTAVSEIVIALAPLGAAVLETISTIAKWIGKFAEANPAMFKVIATIGVLIAAIAPIIVMIANVVVAITSIIGAFGGMGVAAKVLGTVMSTVGKGIALLFSPAGLIAIAVIGLAILIYKYWDEIKAFLSAAWDGIKKGAEIAWNAIKDFFVKYWDEMLMIFTGPIGILVGLIVKNWDSIKATSEKVWTAIKDFFIKWWDELLALITGPIGMLVYLIAHNWDTIKATTATVWNAIKDFFVNLWNGIKTTFTTVVTAISTFLTTTWNTIKSTITTVFNAIKTFFTTTWNTIKTSITTVVNAIKTTLTTVWNAIKTTITTVWNSIKSTATTVWNGIKSAVTTPINSAKTSLSSTANTIKSTLSNAWNSVKSTASSVWNSIKSAITKPVNDAWTAVKAVVNKLKNAFKFTWSLPKLKMPKVSVSMKTNSWGIPYPDFNVQWYKTGGVFTKPVIAGNGGFGDVQEAIVPFQGPHARRIAGLIAGEMDTRVGGGQAFNITINANSEEQGRAAARGFYAEVKKRGIDLRGGY